MNWYESVASCSLSRKLIQLYKAIKPEDSSSSSSSSSEEEQVKTKTMQKVKFIYEIKYNK